MSIATKVLVMDLYAVQYAIPARKLKTRTNHSKNRKNTQPKPEPNKNDREKWDRNQQWELHA